MTRICALEKTTMLSLISGHKSMIAHVEVRAWDIAMPSVLSVAVEELLVSSVPMTLDNMALRSSRTSLVNRRPGSLQG